MLIYKNIHLRINFHKIRLPHFIYKKSCLPNVRVTLNYRKFTSRRRGRSQTKGAFPFTTPCITPPPYLAYCVTPVTIFHRRVSPSRSCQYLIREARTQNKLIDAPCYLCVKLYTVLLRAVRIAVL